MTLADFTNRQLIMPDLCGGETASVIRELTQLLQMEGCITDSLAFFEAALQREFMAPTQVSSIVAFPHARLASVNRLSFAFGRGAVPIAWGGKHDSVRLIFLLAIPPAGSGAYLDLLSAFSVLIRNPNVRNRLLCAESADEVFALLERVNLSTAMIERATAEIDT
jgi:mannitol/fructose-specific phosphotransferase system IIA component (Ntr-type)